MEFRILGPVEVVEHGRVLPLGGSRQRALLALLLTRANEVVSADRLIDELWPAEPPQNAANALQYHVSQLRKSLGADAIATQPPGYVLRVGANELDLLRFERLVSEAAREAPAAASELLGEALALWRGSPLLPNDCNDRPRGGARRTLARRRELWVVAEHRPLELLERGARLDPELIDEGSAGLPVRLQRLGVPPGPVQRAHQHRARALTQRMLANERLDLADDVGMPAAPEIGFEH